MDVDFCAEGLEGASHNYCAQEFFSTDQGSQFTSDVFSQGSSRPIVSVSAWTGRSYCHDNIFVERPWETVKSEYVYLDVF